MRKLLAVLFFFTLPALGQNCTGMRPALNTAPIVTGAVSLIGNNTTKTITVNLTTPFTTTTGWVTIVGSFAMTSYDWAHRYPGLQGSYPLLSGNGTTQLVVDATNSPNSVAGGVAGNIYNGSITIATGYSPSVSDLRVQNTNPSELTFEWTTPGTPSSSTVNFVNDDDSVGRPGAPGNVTRNQDQMTGVTDHVMVVDNLDPTMFNPATPTGTKYPITYFYSVASACFTGGVPDRQNLLSTLPTGVAWWASFINMPAAPRVAGQNLWIMQGYNGNNANNVSIPAQDGVHSGFRTAPGGTITVPMIWKNMTLPPATTASGNAVFNISDWATPGLLSTYGWAGSSYGVGGSSPIPGACNTTPLPAYCWQGPTQNIAEGEGPNGGVLNLVIASNVPTGGTGCTSAGGTIITIDQLYYPPSGLTACAYPLAVTMQKCDALATVCGPLGTTSGNVSQKSEFWAIIFNPPAVTQNPVGPYPGGSLVTSSNPAGIKCVNQNPTQLMTDGCLWRASGNAIPTGGIQNSYFSFEGIEQGACSFNGGIPNLNAGLAAGDYNFFYDGGHVCVSLYDLLGNGPYAPNMQSAHHIIGDFMQITFPRRQEAGSFAVYTPTTAAATTVNNPSCANVLNPTVTRASLCAESIVPLANTDISAMANGFAAGEQYKVCFNTPTTKSPDGCGLFPTRPVAPVSGTAGGNLPASTSYPMVIVYMAQGNIPSYMYQINPGYLTPTVTTDATCPASGNCSITVQSPATTPNAVNCTPSTACGWQVFYQGIPQNPGPNPGGTPIPIGQSFTFGTTANPLQTTGTPFGINFTAWTANVLAVDATARTITVDANVTTGAQAAVVNSTVIVRRSFSGVPADATTTPNAVVCSGCNLTSVATGNPATNDIIYCGVTGSDSPSYSISTTRGSIISSVSGQAINLVTPLSSCVPGTHFEIRQRSGQPIPLGYNIYNWTAGLYDMFQRDQNFIAADTLYYMSTSVGGYTGVGMPSLRRENALAVRRCQLQLDLVAQIGAGNSAVTPTQRCTPGGAPLSGMMDLQTNNGQASTSGGQVGPIPMNGTNLGGFLNGVQLWAQVKWLLDPVANPQGLQNNLLIYWIKHMLDTLYPYYESANSPVTLNCADSSGSRVSRYPHEWAYDTTYSVTGYCDSSGGWGPISFGLTGELAADYWSTQGIMSPAYAFFYWLTGNATIPTYNTHYPAGMTYGDFYNITFPFTTVYAAQNAPQVQNGKFKTLGEVGMWQKEAIQWMAGNTSGPIPLTITTTNLPSGTQGLPYTGILAATGGTAPYTWSAAGLPAGLSVSGSSITGTPTGPFSGSVSVTVTDSATTPATATSMIPLTISSTTPPIISGIPPFTYPIP